ncbi:MAG: hypothetical protein WDO13_18535 [Verrucomicrobiota bacterium]
MRLSEGLFGMPYDQAPNVWRSGSPVYFAASGNPPMLLMHGGRRQAGAAGAGRRSSTRRWRTRVCRTSSSWSSTPGTAFAPEPGEQI